VVAQTETKRNSQPNGDPDRFPLLVDRPVVRQIAAVKDQVQRVRSHELAQIVPQVRQQMRTARLLTPRGCIRTDVRIRQVEYFSQGILLVSAA